MNKNFGFPTLSLSNSDSFFIEIVMKDVLCFVQRCKNNRTRVLLLPPINSYRRFLVHKLINESFAKYKLSTCSIGKDYGRRTVIFPSELQRIQPETAFYDMSMDLPIVNDPLIKKEKLSCAPIYLPPGARKVNSNVEPTRTKDRKVRKPDAQIYVPRAKRNMLMQTQLDVEPCGRLIDKTSSHKDIDYADKLATKGGRVRLRRSRRETQKMSDSDEVIVLEDDRDNQCDWANKTNEEEAKESRIMEMETAMELDTETETRNINDVNRVVNGNVDHSKNIEEASHCERTIVDKQQNCVNIDRHNDDNITEMITDQCNEINTNTTVTKNQEEGLEKGTRYEVVEDMNNESVGTEPAGHCERRNTEKPSQCDEMKINTVTTNQAENFEEGTRVVVEVTHVNESNKLELDDMKENVTSFDKSVGDKHTNLFEIDKNINEKTVEKTTADFNMNMVSKEKNNIEQEDIQEKNTTCEINTSRIISSETHQNGTEGRETSENKAVLIDNFVDQSNTDDSCNRRSQNADNEEFFDAMILQSEADLSNATNLSDESHSAAITDPNQSKESSIIVIDIDDPDDEDVQIIKEIKNHRLPKTKKKKKAEECLNSSQSSQSSSNSSVNSSAKASPAKAINVDECDWDELFDDEGEYIDTDLVDELMKTIGKVKVARAVQDYREFQTIEERSADGECIIEIYGFPEDFKTVDLLSVMNRHRTNQQFQIRWVDDTHALGIFSSPLIADQVLNEDLPFIKTRPLRLATAKSRLKAKNLSALSVDRPKTCVSLARRLVSGHLGMKIDVPHRQKEAERKLLSEAREQKRLIAKQKLEVWES